MSDESYSQVIEFPEIPYEERLWLAQETWTQGGGAVSIHKTALLEATNPTVDLTVIRTYVKISTGNNVFGI